ncbi:MAG: toll/interleukin-1 receptor domain-containing protein [Oscillospiraceae bacterium]|nr:toll/interleukin-1 receptor domain-containing protein [Oscillospiraceae bacterium]
MLEDKIPKIFISYSWSSDDLVVPLAERLVSHGVDVVLDKWDLKEGQDKYAFMEQCVNDPDIDKVLIVCDKKYAEKANKREGGVGDETAIISPEIYGNVKQEKFVPIIAECDEEGNPYVPAYIKSRIYIDLSNVDNYEDEYEKLLRNIYEKPLIKKPKLGAKPEWLEEDKANIFPIQDLVKQIKGATASKKQEVLTQRFIAEYIETLKQYYDKNVSDPKVIFETFIGLKSVRDCFLDFLDALLGTECDIGSIIAEAFETMYNTLIYAKTYSKNACSCNDYEFEIYKCHIWELFICVVTFLRFYKQYKSLNHILTNTYFLITSPLEGRKIPTNYSAFRHWSDIIESGYKPTTENKNKHTLMGHTLCNEREKLPIYTGEAMAQTDLFLYQIFDALNVTIDENYRPYYSYWFPTCYVYAYDKSNEWEYLKSRKRCEQLFDLFGVSSIEALKEAVSKCTYDRDMRYNSAYHAAPAILSYIKLEDIATMN